MKSYGYSMASLTDRDLALSDRAFAEKILREMPQAKFNRQFVGRSGSTLGKDSGHHWSCHALTRIVSKYLTLPWTIIDGWYGQVGCQHSWLQTERYILDVYPIATIDITPLLLDHYFVTRNIYIFPHYAIEHGRTFDDEAAIGEMQLKEHKSACDVK